MKNKGIILIILSISIIFCACSNTKDENLTTLNVTASTTSFDLTVSEKSPDTTLTTNAVSEATTITFTESQTQSTSFASTVPLSEAVTASTVNIPETVTEKEKNVCFITIDCKTIKDNMSLLKKEKQPFVTESGYILETTEFELNEEETAFDVLKKACSENTCCDNCKYCQKNGIQLEFSYTPAFESYYVEGIHQLYERDCGSLSGWMACINGEYINESLSDYIVKPGDRIELKYTCDMGSDIGA